jgi:hypothetical protein
MHGMTLADGNLNLLKELPHFKQMLADFERRANERAFAAVRFTIYLHFALFFH